MVNQMENSKKGKGMLVVIIVLVLLVLGLSGYIVYDKIFTKENERTKEPVKAENKVEEQQKLLTNDEATSIGQGLYLKTRDLYVGQVAKLMEEQTYNWLGSNNDNYVLENGIATKADIENTDGCGLYKYPDEVATAIKNLFTKTGLEKFMNSELSNNKRWVAKDNNDNFYMSGCLSRSGTTVLDEITIVPTKIENNSISFTVSDYWFEAGLADSDYNINSSKATKIDNTFKIVKENDNWKVEDYTDSYNKFLEKNN